MWVVIDPSLRILFMAPYGEADAVFARLRALAPPDDHAGVLLHAPVMIVPRLFDPDLCERLIGYYQTHGGQPSGVMREQNGRTVGVLDDFKKRWDATVEDEGLQNETREALRRRLVPEVLKAFRFKATRVERYIVARYDAEDGGYFRPHRDNLTSGNRPPQVRRHHQPERRLRRRRPALPGIRHAHLRTPADRRRGGVFLLPAARSHPGDPRRALRLPAVPLRRPR